jgi:hypothetical protein
MMQSHLSVFVFISWAIEFILRKYLPMPVSSGVFQYKFQHFSSYIKIFDLL